MQQIKRSSEDHPDTPRGHRGQHPKGRHLARVPGRAAERVQQRAPRTEPPAAGRGTAAAARGARGAGRRRVPARSPWGGPGGSARPGGQEEGATGLPRPRARPAPVPTSRPRAAGGGRPGGNGRLPAPAAPPRPAASPPAYLRVVGLPEPGPREEPPRHGNGTSPQPAGRSGARRGASPPARPGPARPPYVQRGSTAMSRGEAAGAGGCGGEQAEMRAGLSLVKISFGSARNVWLLKWRTARSPCAFRFAGSPVGNNPLSQHSGPGQQSYPTAACQ